MKNLIRLLTAFAAINMALAQVTFVKTLDIPSSNNETLNSVDELNDGGYIFGGEMELFDYKGTADLDMSSAIIRTNSSGNVLWNTGIGTNGFSHAKVSSIFQTGDNNNIIGTTWELDYSTLFKLDMNGTLVWAKTDTSKGEFRHAIEATDGDYVISGQEEKFGVDDFRLFKVAPDGSLQWSKSYGTNGDCYCAATHVVQTADGGFAFTGLIQKWSTGGDGYDVALIKTNVNGVIQWAKIFGTTGTTDYDAGYSIIETNDGGLAVAGYTTTETRGEYIILLKTDASGNVDFAKKYGNAAGYEQSGNGFMVTDNLLAQKPSGEYFIGGYTTSLTNYFDGILMKISSDGNSVEKVSVYGSTGWDALNAMKLTSGNEIILVGQSNSYGDGSFDGLIVKADIEGNVPCELDSITITASDWNYNEQDIAGLINTYNTGMLNDVTTALDTGSLTLDTNQAEHLKQKEICCDGLPVELISFSGKNRSGMNELQWITAGEMNNDYFTLQRSAYGNNWETIAKIHGAGISNTQKVYSFTDMNPLTSANYYRLIQTDFDGTMTVAGKIMVFAGEKHNDLTVRYMHDGTVEISFQQGVTGLIYLYNSVGQLLKQAETGRVFRMSSEEYPRGTYIVRCMDENRSVTKKITIGK